MTDDTDLMTDFGHEDAFEVQMRGYSRRQVDEFVARSRSQTRELEERLAQALDEVEGLRLELTSVRQGPAPKPAHEEISERVGQILKLADDEAKAQRTRAQEDITHQREDAKKEGDRIRSEAREQAERMLKAAQDQAESAISSARAEADKLRNSARAETERAIADASKEADSTLASAKAQAKQMLDEATVRASAIHDGAERRLNLLTSRHTETMRRLTEIRDVVTNLVASEATRGSLEDEVAKSVASSFAAAQAGARQQTGPRPGGPGQAPAAGRPAGRDPFPERGAADTGSPQAAHRGQRPGMPDDPQVRRDAVSGEQPGGNPARTMHAPGAPGGTGVRGPNGGRGDGNPNGGRGDGTEASPE